MNKYVPSYLIKLHARNTLKGNFLKAFCAVVTEAVILLGLSALIIAFMPGGFDHFRLMIQGTFSSMEEQIMYQADVINMFTGVMNLVSILFAFVSVGCCGMFLGIIRRKKVEFKNVFAYYNQWYIALIYPLAVGAVTYIIGLLTKALNSVGLPDAVLMLVTTMADCTIIFITFKMVFVNYALSDNGCTSVVEAVKTSWNLTNGKTFVNLFALIFSFAGWFFLSMFTMGIAMIYALPYIQASLATLYDMTRSLHVVNQKNEA